MTFVSEAHVPTQNAARYANQVGKHWAHNLDVKEENGAQIITFPADARGASWPGVATVTLTAQDDGLVCRIVASAAGQRDGLKSAVERHIDRFAFREAPLTYVWQDR